MNDFKVYKTIHFPDEWAEQITLMHHKQWNTNKGTYMYYNVRYMNLDSKHNFYILGILNDKVIASCFVETYKNYETVEQIEKYDEYLISSLIVDKDYQRQGYGTSFIKSVIRILKEENAIKIVAFACENSRRLFEKLGFTKNENIKSFGSIYPGDDDSVYYELNLESNFYLSKLNKDDIRFVSKSMMNEFYKNYKCRNDEEPYILLPNISTYENTIMSYSTNENALVKTVRCSRIAVGYTHIYYTDHEDDNPKYSEHSINIEFYLDEDYLFKSALVKIVDEARNFYNTIKEKHNINQLKVCLSKYTILMRRYDFYKRCLLEIGFEQKDKETFTLKVE